MNTKDELQQQRKQRRDEIERNLAADGSISKLADGDLENLFGVFVTEKLFIKVYERNTESVYDQLTSRVISVSQKRQLVFLYRGADFITMTCVQFEVLCRDYFIK